LAIPAIARATRQNFDGDVGWMKNDQSKISPNILQNVGDLAENSWQTVAISSAAYTSRYKSTVGFENCHFCAVWTYLNPNEAGTIENAPIDDRLLRLKSVGVPTGWKERIKYDEKLMMWVSNEIDHVFKKRAPLTLTLVDDKNLIYFKRFLREIASLMSGDYRNTGLVFNGQSSKPTEFYSFDTGYDLGDIELFVFTSTGEVKYKFIFEGVCLREVPDFFGLDYNNPASHEYTFTFDYKAFIVEM